MTDPMRGMRYGDPDFALATRRVMVRRYTGDVRGQWGFNATVYRGPSRGFYVMLALGFIGVSVEWSVLRYPMRLAVAALIWTRWNDGRPDTLYRELHANVT